LASMRFASTCCCGWPLRTRRGPWNPTGSFGSGQRVAATLPGRATRRCSKAPSRPARGSSPGRHGHRRASSSCAGLQAWIVAGQRSAWLGEACSIIPGACYAIRCRRPCTTSSSHALSLGRFGMRCWLACA
jgi:hypothetical protein